MGDKSRNLLIRSLSGLVLLGIVLAAVFCNKYTFGALLLLIVIVGEHEFYRLARGKGLHPQSLVGIVAGIVMSGMCFILFARWGEGFDRGNTLALVSCGLYLIMLVPLIFIGELFSRSDSPLGNIAATLTGVLYVAYPVSFLLFIPLMLGGGEWRPLVFLMYLFITWANDVFAYLVGMSIGRHRMCERISPKKSWEGFFGGVAGALGLGALGAYLTDGSYAVWIGAAAAASVAGVLGDLVESMFKRSSEVKDSGALMPGHGGVLDRFDALLISSPIVFVYLAIVLL